jgi:hypothetical protein
VHTPQNSTNTRPLKLDRRKAPVRLPNARPVTSKLSGCMNNCPVCSSPKAAKCEVALLSPCRSVPWAQFFTCPCSQAPLGLMFDCVASLRSSTSSSTTVACRRVLQRANMRKTLSGLDRLKP